MEVYSFIKIYSICIKRIYNPSYFASFIFSINCLHFSLAFLNYFKITKHINSLNLISKISNKSASSSSSVSSKNSSSLNRLVSLPLYLSLFSVIESSF